MDCFFDRISQCTAGVSATNRTARPPRPEQGQLPYPPRRFLPVWAEALRGTSASYCAATQASARASPSASKGNSAKAFCVSSVFSKHQGNGHTQAESVPSVYFSRYHMPPCPPEKLLLAFKYTRPGVVTVNSSILSLRAAKQPQQNRTCCGFAWFNVLKALCASTGACALHTRGRASGSFEVIIP